MQHHQQTLPYRMHRMTGIWGLLQVFMGWRAHLVLLSGLPISSNSIRNDLNNSGVDVAATAGLLQM